jgi:SOS response regulatory protein OraA/RecX
MSDTVSRHITRFPNARPSTIQYLTKRDETTQRLRQELGMQKSRKPWWQDVLDLLKRRGPQR